MVSTLCNIAITSYNLLAIPHSPLTPSCDIRILSYDFRAIPCDFRTIPCEFLALSCGFRANPCGLFTTKSHFFIHKVRANDGSQGV